MFDIQQDMFSDEIVTLMKAYADDPRPSKVDLGVGVYRDENGETPIMQAVYEAEAQLHLTQRSKSYLGMEGDRDFCTAVCDLVLGNDSAPERVAAIQTPGGASALRLLGELFHSTDDTAVAWIPDPTWPNHEPILTAAGMRIRQYRYLDQGAVKFDLERCLQDLCNAKAGDIVVLHACCHNPTGADPSPEEWRLLADFLNSRGLLPLLDLAYLGLGDDLKRDLTGVLIIAERLPEFALAFSCSKSFSVYRDRVGAIICRTRNQRDRDATLNALRSLARTSYSMPPDHGAAVVKLVLTTPEFRTLWQDELAQMRAHLQHLRLEFANALAHACGTTRFDYIRTHKGMFSCLPLTSQQCQLARERHGIYMLGNGRINVGGLAVTNIDQIAKIIASGMNSTGKKEKYL